MRHTDPIGLSLSKPLPELVGHARDNLVVSRETLRRQVVELAMAGRTPGEVSREIDFFAQSITAWMARAADGKRGPVPQWQQQIEVVAQLPDSQHQFVARTIKTLLAEAGAR